MAIRTFIVIITLNVNGLNAPTKSQRLAKWIKRKKPNKTCIYAVYKRPTSDLGIYRLKMRGSKKVFHANQNQKKAQVAILISDKIDFKIRNAGLAWWSSG